MSQITWTKDEGFGANRDGEPIRVAIANGAAVSRGTPLGLLDPRTASSGCLAAQPLAGVAYEDHKPNDGITSISVWTNGIFSGTASGAITAGHWVKMSKEGYISEMMASSSGALAASYAAIFGNSYQTVSDGESVQVRLKL